MDETLRYQIEQRAANLAKRLGKDKETLRLEIETSVLQQYSIGMDGNTYIPNEVQNSSRNSIVRLIGEIEGKGWHEKSHMQVEIGNIIQRSIFENRQYMIINDAGMKLYGLIMMNREEQMITLNARCQREDTSIFCWIAPYGTKCEYIILEKGEKSIELAII